MQPAYGWLRPVFWAPSDTLAKTTRLSLPHAHLGSVSVLLPQIFSWWFLQLSHALFKSLWQRLALGCERCGDGAWGRIMVSPGCPSPVVLGG